MSVSGAPVPAFTDLQSSRCVAHGAREAVALCRTCFSPRCGECVVKVDGVNHCGPCHVRLFPRAELRASAAPDPAETGGAAMTFFRVVFVLGLYSVIAFAAASAGVAYPFFANERLLAANRVRVTDVHLALSDYFADFEKYPDMDRGLRALLAANEEEREDWRGPYATARAKDGRPARDPADDGKVLDVFGRPLFYWAAPLAEDDEDGVPDLIYLASPGANGVYETPGVYEGKAPRDESGDDVIQWVVWP